MELICNEKFMRFGSLEYCATLLYKVYNEDWPGKNQICWDIFILASIAGHDCVLELRGFCLTTRRWNFFHTLSALRAKELSTF